MLNSATLSLEQAPPISVPFRFFLTAPLFAAFAGLLMIYYGEGLFVSRWMPSTLAFVHLLTIGFLAMVMCGAMMQMLPVLAGVSVPRALLYASIVHLFLIFGTLFLVAGFIYSDSLFFTLALFQLGVGFGLFILLIVVTLLRVKVKNNTVKSMWLAIIGLLIAIALGLLLAQSLISPFDGFRPAMMTDLHLSWGLLGWIGLLVMGVAFQVVPMFQITPEYPQSAQRFLPLALLISLAVWSLGVVYEVNLIQELSGLAVIIGYLLFALSTLILQAQRKRKVADITLLFWRIGMLSIVASAVLIALGKLFPEIISQSEFTFLMGGFLIVSFALSVINGMLYKIVPFLTWFHLQQRNLALPREKRVKLPNMKTALPDRVARRQLIAHITMLVLLFAAIFQPQWFARAAGVALFVSSMMLWWNLIVVTRSYRAYSSKLLRRAAGA